MDLESRDRWVDFSRAKDEMFAHTNIPEAPWFTVEANDKRRARLNCIRHLLSKVPYEDMTPSAIELAPRKGSGDYQRPPSTNSFLCPITIAEPLPGISQMTAGRLPYRLGSGVSGASGQGRQQASSGRWRQAAAAGAIHQLQPQGSSFFGAVLDPSQSTGNAIWAAALG
jgi:hypothetical protein